MDKVGVIHGYHRLAPPFANLDDITHILFEWVNCVKNVI